MHQRLTDSRLANLGANAIHEAFDAYQTQFKAITRRATTHFEKREWRGMQMSAAARLDLYRQVVDQVVAKTRHLLNERIDDKLVWASMKAVYSGLISGRDDWELAETFFNSITRRIFATVGVDPQIEFIETDFETPPTQDKKPIYRTYVRSTSTTAGVIATILQDYRFNAPYENLQRDSQRVAREIENHLHELQVEDPVERVELVEPVFYRGKGAYLVGRFCCGSHLFPLVLALLHPSQGVMVDAVLLEENEVSILFSFARSYFHVAVERPYDLVSFLKTVIPRKRIAELYISIGYNKHGKTELYRDLIHHVARTDDKFVIAEGEKGLVMAVFTMPNYNLVFKVIKDNFAYPKNTTRQKVKDKYRLVFKHDRAGRLVDAQEFEHLKFDRSRFSQELLQELLGVAAKTVQVENGHVIVKHAYVERRVTPLNVYLQDANKKAAKAVIMDYGKAIKDLAATNIFPGDMLLKNFGVTRHGRVIFYDYDELALLTECNFRRMPPPRDDYQALSPEPWFTVAENDFFPEEFERFCGLYGELREWFMAHHGELFDVDFWHKIQARLNNGEVLDIFPYDESRRLEKDGHR